LDVTTNDKQIQTAIIDNSRPPGMQKSRKPPGAMPMKSCSAYFVRAAAVEQAQAVFGVSVQRLEK
jgi:hypothetical protein